MAQWGKIRSKGRVDDRRGLRSQAVGGIGLTGIAIVLAVAYFGGGEQAAQVAEIIQDVNQQQVSGDIGSQEGTAFEGEDSYEQFAVAALGSVNDLWFDALSSYREPTLVLFRDRTNSACGGATSAIGPHYCPADETIYLDETFFDELQSRFGARGGDVAEAYVIAHEVGHHVQTVLGTSRDVRTAQSRNPSEKNALSIKQELQADCYAGLWAHSLRGQGIFDDGEIVEAIDAAEAVGDDHIQETVQGHVHPESWTHGSSDDRKKWFLRGYEGGGVAVCDTFS